MASNPTCSRCGKTRTPVGYSESWADYWPNFGRIEIGFAAQIGYALGLPSPFAEGHPTVDGGAQKAIISWGRLEPESEFETHPYQMCRSCQKALLALIGDFFKYGESSNEATT